MIKLIGNDELAQARDLVSRVFSEYVAGYYPERGVKTFYEFLDDPVLLTKIKMWGCFDGGKIVGVIATKSVTHICLMFVDKQEHKKGIAKQLILTAFEDVRARSEASDVTVNSSPYAVEFYERMGFVKTGEQQEKDGIVFTPMTANIKHGRMV